MPRLLIITPKYSNSSHSLITHSLPCNANSQHVPYKMPLKIVIITNCRPPHWSKAQCVWLLTMNYFLITTCLISFIQVYSIPGTSKNFKYGLDLERVHPASWGQLGSYLIQKYRIWFRKSKVIDWTECNANHIIPLYCHLPVGFRSLADRCGSLGSCKPQI